MVGPGIAFLLVKVSGTSILLTDQATAADSVLVKFTVQTGVPSLTMDATPIKPVGSASCNIGNGVGGIERGRLRGRYARH